MEHFGAVIGCYVIALYPTFDNKCGQLEIVHHELSGLLWRTIEEVKERKPN